MITEQFPPNSKGKIFWNQIPTDFHQHVCYKWMGYQVTWRARRLWCKQFHSPHTLSLSIQILWHEKSWKALLSQVRFPIKSQNKDVFRHWKTKILFTKKKEKIQHQNKKESNKTQHDMEETVAAELWYRNNIRIRK